MQYTPEQIVEEVKNGAVFTFIHTSDPETIYTLKYIPHKDGLDFKVSWEDPDTGSWCYKYSQVIESLRASWEVQNKISSVKHKHYDLIKQWIENPSAYIVQTRNIGDEYWYTCDPEPYWAEDQEYQLILKTKVKVYQWLYFDLSTNRWLTTDNKYKDKPFNREDCTPILQSEEEVLESEI